MYLYMLIGYCVISYLFVLFAIRNSSSNISQELFDSETEKLLVFIFSPFAVLFCLPDLLTLAVNTRFIKWLFNNQSK